MMVGGFYLAIFIGSMVSGKLGGLFGEIEHSAFWLIHGLIALFGALIFAVFAKKISAVLD
jgi:POT family proton-dependent oligopeptide transporter